MTKNDLYGMLHKSMQQSAHLTRSSAEVLLQPFMQTGYAVVDFGCGRGDWLKAALSMGASAVQGVEAKFECVEPIDVPVFYGDLASGEINLERKFDIGVCVEVAEHLPPHSARGLVRNITRHCDMVIFTAAAPGQGGVFHLNERPPKYWSDMFIDEGFTCYDIREEFWDNAKIEAWYRQSLLIFERKGKHLVPEAFRNKATKDPKHLIHPDIFKMYAPQDSHVIFYEDGMGGFNAVKIPYFAVRDEHCEDAA